MADDQRASSGPMSRQERGLIVIATVLAVLLVLVAVGLWLRFGEGVYTSRIVSMIANCL